MRLTFKFPLLAFFGSLLLTGGLWAQTYSIIDLGKERASSVAHGLSQNGQVAGALGGAHGDNISAFYWPGQGKGHEIGRKQRSDYSEAFGVNNAGQVVGTSNVLDGMRAFSWTRSSGIVLLPPLTGDSSSTANSVNDSGTIVGFSSGPSGMNAVAWQGQAPLAVLPLNLAPSEALAINPTGTIVGFYGSGDKARGFSLSGGTLATLQALPGDNSSQAFAVNSAGDVAGISNGSNGSHAVAWNSGTPTNLGFLQGGDHSAAFGINSSGQVVGNSGSNMGLRAFLWTAADGMRDLNALIPPNSNVLLMAAVAINDAGQIVAVGSLGHDLKNDRQAGLDRDHHSGVTRVFLLNPVK